MVTDEEPWTNLPRADGHVDRMLGRINQLTKKVVEQEETIKELREKKSKPTSRSLKETDDIISEDSLATELTITRNALVDAEEYIRTLVTENEHISKDLTMYAEINAEYAEENDRLKTKYDQLKNMLKKTKVWIRKHEKDQVCPICLDNVEEEVTIGSCMCYSSHAICTSCFNQLREDEKLFCLTCRFQWFTPDLILWSPYQEPN